MTTSQLVSEVPCNQSRTLVTGDPLRSGVRGSRFRFSSQMRRKQKLMDWFMLISEPASIHRIAENWCLRRTTYSWANCVLPDPEIPHRTTPFFRSDGCSRCSIMSGSSVSLPKNRSVFGGSSQRIAHLRGLGGMSDISRNRRAKLSSEGQSYSPLCLEAASPGPR